MRLVLLLLVPLSFVTTNLLAQDEKIPKIEPADLLANRNLEAQKALESLQKRVWQTKVDLHCQNLPLEAVIEQLAKKADCTIRIDRAEVDPQTPISMDVEGLSLHSMLQVMLRPLGWGYEVKPQEVVITHLSLNSPGYVTHFYPVEDFLDPGHGPMPAHGELWQLLLNVLDVHWRNFGMGSATAMNYRDGLVVRQTQRTHWRLEQLLAHLRTAKNLPNSPYPTRPLAITGPVADPQELYERLRGTHVTLEWKGGTLDQFVRAFRRQTQLPLFVDPTNLRVEEIPGANEIDVQWKNITAYDALNQFTAAHKLWWKIVDDRIEITKTALPAAELLRRVYPVRDLIWYGLVLPPELKQEVGHLRKVPPLIGGGTGVPYPNPLFAADLPALPDYDSLIDVIHESIPDPAGHVYTFPAADCLVIYDSLENHQKIEDLLTQLRANIQPLDPADLRRAIARAQAEVVVMPYMVRTDDQGEPMMTQEELEELAATIKQQFSPDSWNEEGHFIHVTSKQLVIQTRRDIQRRVSNFLVDIEGLGARWYGSWSGRY